ncbi:MAG: sigma-70 family RNA polymerase sigma factor [Chloroflexi bacterium CFX4]|nr:sigma-70 family RNA polymerase sigma factor [Chloroflexi bacterium CFX4]MDL1923967.1 sigma-70 family RNA polymerase sigma factor [Chloroflexi bacterium CFX3]
MDSVSIEQESAWLISARQGDQAAFGELVQLHQNAVYNLAYRILGNRVEAEDAAQETFLRAYANLERYDMARPFRTWLLSITSNFCIDRLRRRRLKWLSIDEPLPPRTVLHSEEIEPEAAAIASERTALIQSLLAELSPEHRAAVVLHYWYDYSYQEIAEMLRTTESAIKSRLFRARQTLAAKLTALQPDMRQAGIFEDE